MCVHVRLVCVWRVACDLRPLARHRLPVLGLVTKHRHELLVGEAEAAPCHPGVARAQGELRMQVPMQHLRHMAPAQALVPGS